MYNIGDTVVYGMTGVCRIEDVCFKEFTRGDVKKYYVLKPIGSESSTIYAPFGSSDGMMRAPLAKAEAERLIALACSAAPDVPAFFDREECIRIMKDPDRLPLLHLLRALHAHKDDVLRRGKKVRLSEENLLKTAERLIAEEFSLALECKADEALRAVLRGGQ